ncbi:hypothetical protein F1C16_15650 [Hymenobacter sp. NBH84]|uniref:hypothetical protein n=1 Tax=Hymenobacter sp. NBH84 TaxID=2596915 RepID=UPI001628C3BE|nr:hypothetical protein [Hymenobacter sp. NBH84]QNE40895.1 hypothetical protein F1C16_15650 [Hymenobacter sp. NBH84]
MATTSFSMILAGDGPEKPAHAQTIGVSWCGAPGTQFKFNLIPNDWTRYCGVMFFVGGVQIGAVDANLTGEQCAVTHNGTTYTTVLSAAGWGNTWPRRINLV